MLTIEQVGNMKKLNTIDELIIEYIRTYACKCNSNNSGGNLNAEEMKNYVNDALKGVSTEYYVNQVIKNIDLSEFFTYTSLEEHLPEPVDLSVYAKRTELDAYAKKDDIQIVESEVYSKDEAYEMFRKRDDLQYHIYDLAEGFPNTPFQGL